jgi:transcriptional regulator with XRE-family HTH domain
MDVNALVATTPTLDFVMATKAKGKKKPAKSWQHELGARLAELRKQRGYSQEELARRIGAVQVVISDYEHGRLRLSAEMALRFAAALDVPIQELLQPSEAIAVEPAQRPSRRLLRRLEQIEQLPRRKQAALLTTIDTFLENNAAKTAS